MEIKFNQPYRAKNTKQYLEKVLKGGNLGIEGTFTNLCEQWLEKKLCVKKVLLTQSCTAALELSVRLIKTEVDDEIILPSFTYVSSANCIVMAGSRPIFVDIDPESLTIDVSQIEKRINKRTKGIICVHYGGYPCDFQELSRVCDHHNLFLIEDSAHSTGGTCNGQALGTFGQLGALSFHETKNITCGQGGALLINDENLISNAHILSQRGTDRKNFLNGNVGKYTWKNIGSSWLMSEVHAAILWSQLEEFDLIQKKRREIWSFYHENLMDLERDEYLRRPPCKFDKQDSFHNYYIIINKKFDRDSILNKLTAKSVQAVSHYEPLHLSEAGERFSKERIFLPVTEAVSGWLIRLPFHNYLKSSEQEFVVEVLTSVLKN